MVQARRHDEVVRITTAAEGRSADIAHRQRRYLISMTIRTLCFVGAVFARGVHWLWPLLIAAAFVLPYVAVVMANQASPSLPADPVEGPGREHKELG